MDTQPVAPTVATATPEADLSSIPVAPKRGRTRNPELKERCKVLYFQGLTHSAIAEITGVAPNLLRAWASRHGWVKAVAAAKQVIAAKGQRGLAIVNKSPSDASNRTRETLANVIQKAAGKLSEVELGANVKEIKKLGKALEPLVRSAKIVHSWGTEGVAGIVAVDLLGKETEAPAVDVETLSCGLDTPTDSVPAEPAEHATPQSAQLVDNQEQGSVTD